MKKLFYLLVLLLLTAHAATGQMTKWILNPNEIDFAAGMANGVNTGASIPYKVENAVYKEGVLQFYANDGRVYDALGNYVGQFANDPGAMLKEIAVAPGPGTCNTWCVFWLETSPLSALTFHYQEVTVENGNVSFGAGGTSGDGVLFGNDGGIAVSHVLAGTQADRDVYVVAFDAVRRFRLSTTGLALLQTFSLGNLSGSGFIAEADLSPDGKYLTWNKENRIIVMETSPLSLFNSITIGSSSSTIYGLEFSDDGNYIYVCHSTLGLRRWTFSGAEVEALSESNTYNNTQLELARDGYIYAVRNDGVLGIIQGLSVQQSPMGINVFSDQPVPLSNNYYGLPDQVDGEDYSIFFGIPLVTVNSMSVNNSPLPTDCASPMSVYNCNPILLNATYDGGTPGSYMLEIQAVNSTCALITGSGFLNYQSGWMPGAPPVNLDLTMLTDPAGLSLGNSAGKFLITLTVRNGCRIERSAFGYLNVNGPPSATSVLQFLSGSGNAWGGPGDPPLCQSLPVGNCAVAGGQYSANITVSNSTGVITYYEVTIDEVDCATGTTIATLPSIGQQNVNDISTVPGLGLNFLTNGYFANQPWPALQNRCFKINLEVGNECNFAESWTYFRFDGQFLNTPPGDRGSENSTFEMEANHQSDGLATYPNPVTSFMTIKYPVKNEGLSKIFISDSSGRIVAAETFRQIGSSHEFIYDASALRPGAYYCRFVTPEGVLTCKFLKIER